MHVIPPVTIHHIIHDHIIDAIPDSEQADTLDGLVSEVLSSFNGHLNCFLKGHALRRFAQTLSEHNTITRDLLISHGTYDEVEKQFTTLLSYLDTKDEIEVQCKVFLYALHKEEQGEALTKISRKLKDKWRVKANADLQVHLCLNTLCYYYA